MIAVAIGWYTGYIHLTYIYDNFLTLITAMVVFATAMAVFVYLKALQPGAMLAVGGNSGTMLQCLLCQNICSGQQLVSSARLRLIFILSLTPIPSISRPLPRPSRKQPCLLFRLSLGIYPSTNVLHPGLPTICSHLDPICHSVAGHMMYDFFIGHELNPRIGGWFDIKVFCELRPGLVGWVVLVLGMAAKQYESGGTITNSMFLVVAFQFFYVWDALSSEVRLF